MLKCGMADDAEIRRANFRKLWPGKFSPSKAAHRLWGTPSQWSDLYHGRKSFGEKLARDIEDELDLVRGSLDDPAGPKKAIISSDLATALEGMAEPDRRRAENMLRLHLGLPLLETPASESRKQTGNGA